LTPPKRQHLISKNRQNKPKFQK